MAGFHLYSRRGCHPCELMLERLLELTRGKVAVEVHDVEGNPDWLQKFGLRVPVLTFGEELVCEFRLDTDAVVTVIANLAE
jgi:hypothetical protein